MERYLSHHILSDLDNKIVLLSGPRQVGKTTLAKQLFDAHDYLNFDAVEDRLQLQKKQWDRTKDLIIFDELHKKQDWKQWLKGIYDTEGIPPKLLVTGSARMDTHQKVGDSLAGRYFQHRLHPFDLKEALPLKEWDMETCFNQLWHCSGFPEPFLKGDPAYYKRWRRSHLNIILRQDLIDMNTVSDIQSIETLVAMLKKRIGGTVSYANLARDLGRDINTIKRWLLLLENLYIIFRVTPYHKNVARALMKEPKFYFYDWTYAEDDGARLENMVASALLKELNYLTDTRGIEAMLHFVRTKEGKELDFLIVQDEKPTHLIEVKTSDSDPSPHFKHFAKFFPGVDNIQLVRHLKREFTCPEGLAVRALLPWLAEMPWIPE
ncbi:MAG: ATPase [marine bacterium B5-7]|nr:MAG: ATPase [marine bacterium B5-7]